MNDGESNRWRVRHVSAGRSGASLSRHGGVHNRGMPRLELYPFRYRDARTGKWVRARYLAQVPVIQRHYAEWELIGPPEIRHVATDVRFDYFNPFRSQT